MNVTEGGGGEAQRGGGRDERCDFNLNLQRNKLSKVSADEIIVHKKENTVNSPKNDLRF